MRGNTRASCRGVEAPLLHQRRAQALERGLTSGLVPRVHGHSAEVRSPINDGSRPVQHIAVQSYASLESERLSPGPLATTNGGSGLSLTAHARIRGGKQRSRMRPCGSMQVDNSNTDESQTDTAPPPRAAQHPPSRRATFIDSVLAGLVANTITALFLAFLAVLAGQVQPLKGIAFGTLALFGRSCSALVA